MPTRRFDALFRAAMIALVANAGSARAGDGNLIVNGGFDGDLSGWEPIGPEGSAAWSTMDVDDDGGSGSVRIANALTSANSYQRVLRQCVILPARSHAYRVGAFSYVPGGQVIGYPMVSFEFRLESSNCDEGDVGHSVGLFPIGPFPDAWGSGEFVVEDPRGFPAGSTVAVDVLMHKVPAEGAVRAYVDAVFVIADGVLASGFEALQPAAADSGQEPAE